MAHNLNTKRDGSAAFYSLRQPAWHGLGQVVNVPVGDPDVLRLAGLDWEARKVSLYDADMEVVASHRVVKRSDTGAHLGVVGEGFGLLQNADMLGFFRDVAGASDMTVETAGALGDGGRVWALAKVPALGISIGNDQVNPYLLITNGHNGRHALRVLPTTVRVVCQNTLGMATSRKTGSTLASGWTIRHDGDTAGALKDIARAYAQTRTDWETTGDALRFLASKPSTSDSLANIMAHAFPVKPYKLPGLPGADHARKAKEAAERAEARTKERAQRIAEIRASDTCNVDGTAGTLFADLQAVTEWLDHEGNTNRESRFASAVLEGERAEAKANAWDAAVALAN